MGTKKRGTKGKRRTKLKPGLAKARAAKKRNGNKPRRGRPPHGVGSSVIGVRVSDTEHEKLVNAAKRMQKGISTFLRDAALAVASAAD